MPITAAEWYDANPDITSLYQGDVVTGVPVVFMPPSGDGPWVLLRPSSPVTHAEALAGSIPKVFRPHVADALNDAWATNEELVLAKGVRTKVMIATQTCDLDRRKFIQVAPVYEASTLSPGRQTSLGVNEINYMFYFPDDPPKLQQKHFADLSQITSVHRSYFKGSNLVKRLTGRATVELQKQLATVHGRPFGFNTQDDVPQSTEYSCANCFFSSMAIQRHVIPIGQKFPPCPACGENALWVKVRR